MLNMGGPETTDQVYNYLHRIMTDRDMIQLPFQDKLGPWIAQRRTAEVQQKYADIGGGSPILRWTNVQGELLCAQLDRDSPASAPHRHYVAFRYVQPLTETALQRIEADRPERVVIFSQYPQYSCATSGSSFNAIYTHFKDRTAPAGIEWSVIDRWSTHPLLVRTFAERIRTELAAFPAEKRADVILLFSAHSLPLKVNLGGGQRERDSRDDFSFGVSPPDFQTVSRGDAYPSEVGATVNLVMNELNGCNPYSLVWQSKVGPLPWLAPATDDAIRGYVRQGKKNFIIVPIAFVNEHIETLHELDIEYCDELAAEVGAEQIRRAAAPNDHPLFIEAMSDLVVRHLAGGVNVTPKFLMRCPECVNARCRESKQWYRTFCARR